LAQQRGARPATFVRFKFREKVTHQIFTPQVSCGFCGIFAWKSS
jgi:hypothetical protein